ncbi:hypothetical protein AVU38_gp099 [Ralstonia phage RSL2]|uniref:Uncharacterized protein n=1 Tax=Ralstonia phage RSL2 TaxID=1585840 RepID=A0A0A8J8T7_9CAUD|nr:hypothetical protein AVU38_gp099 [Ralstonia phage RSL2]BAQ02627.1 hypothetical protein [Ralstonia phage RSL2]
MFFHDFDNEDVYPQNGTLEEKAVFSLEQMRTRFWWEKKNYLQNRAGGARHTATLLAYGKRSAEQLAHHAEMAMNSFLKQAYLTLEGETTDPKYPTDKMINTELRRIRALIILNVSQYMEQFDSMMPEDLSAWTKDMIYFNLYPYTTKYINEIYDQIDFVIPKKKLQARSPGDLEKFIDEQAAGFADEVTKRNFTHSVLVQRIRDNMIDFMLNGLPFSNDRLKKSDDLIQKPAEEGEAKPVLH